jgi:hypothetical protein
VIRRAPVAAVSTDHSSLKYCGHTGCVVVIEADGVTELVLQAMPSRRTIPIRHESART